MADAKTEIVEGTVAKTSLKGEQVNNIPNSFKGKVILPIGGWVDAEKKYDFSLVVQQGAQSSRMRASLEGKVETEQGPKDFSREAGTLWAGAISWLQEKITKVIKDGDVVYATI